MVHDEEIYDGQESVSSSEDVNGHTNVAEKGTEDERLTLARRENRGVIRMRGLVFLVLFGTAALISTGTYVLTRHDQEIDFQKAFTADATKIIESFNKAVERRLESIDALSVSITTFAHDSGSTFPNVTISDFAIRGSNTRVLSDSTIIHYHPVVTEKTRKGWEAYQIENRGQFASSLATEMTMMKRQDVQLSNRGERRLQNFTKFNDELVVGSANGTLSVAPNASGPYLPLWQISPVTPTPSIININVLWNPIVRGVYLETMKTGQAVIEAASNLNGENLGNAGALWRLALSMSQYRNGLEEYLGDPASAVGYPVFDSFDPDNRTVVGVIGTNFYWRLYFKNVLPPNSKGIVCVLENTKGQKFTYRVDDSVTYVGTGDHHEKKYDRFKLSTELALHVAKYLSAETKSYTSVSLNSDYCNYKLHIYPSQENEDLYVNQIPVIMMFVILGVFLFTSIVFVLYTVAVSRRQEVVMDRAVASSAIVSSLFPSQVRDRIYQENDNDGNKDWKTNESYNISDANNVPVSGRPIAQVFDHTTILFADMVGFTAWSSKREPVQVFELLETIYRAFDTIAGRRNVFKVETIGDCYVAVTGLPDPQPDHAVIMVKFANECMSKMNQLTTDLASSLGEDTSNLVMRVGMHSGAVTGGVLRGQKSRFQLFGDTMNTASRMESNGMPSRIHVSKDTAEELMAKGKSSWLTAREDKVFAKGKGELQTYWVTPKAYASSVIRTAVVLSEAEGSFTQPVNDQNEWLA